MKLAIQVHEHDSGAVVFHLSGNLHGTTDGYAFQDDIRKRFAAGTRRIIVDLGDVERIDSCGIGIIAAISMSAQNSGGGLVLSALPPRIEKILGVTQFLEHVDHAGSIPEAVTKLDAMAAAGKIEK